MFDVERFQRRFFPFDDPSIASKGQHAVSLFLLLEGEIQRLLLVILLATVVATIEKDDQEGHERQQACTTDPVEFDHFLTARV